MSFAQSLYEISIARTVFRCPCGERLTATDRREDLQLADEEGCCPACWEERCAAEARAIDAEIAASEWAIAQSDFEREALVGEVVDWPSEPVRFVVHVHPTVEVEL